MLTDYVPFGGLITQSAEILNNQENSEAFVNNSTNGSTLEYSDLTQNLQQQHQVLLQEHQQLKQHLQQLVQQNQHLQFQIQQYLREKEIPATVLEATATNGQASTTQEMASNLSSSWQTIPLRRQKRRNDDNSVGPSKKTNSEHDAVSSKNRYEHLSCDENLEATSKSDNINNTTTKGSIQEQDKYRTPPIFIPGVRAISDMIRSIKEVIKDEDFSYKLMKTYQDEAKITMNNVKIVPQTPDVYRKLVKHLNLKNIAHYTFQLKQERAFRVVLKNMHPTADEMELKEAIEAQGHKVRQIHNIKHRLTKAPLSMFFVDLEPQSNNKKIYDVEYLLHAKIRFEPPRKKREIVQCKRCQSYEHSFRYCTLPYSCVKCGKNHDSRTCTKTRDTPATCALCSRDHPANYKGCEVYQKIRNSKYPSQSQYCRNATQNITEGNNSSPLRSNQTIGTGRQLTYAQMTKHSQINNQNVSYENNLISIIQESFKKFESILAKQAEQISSLINIMTAIMKKL